MGKVKIFKDLLILLLMPGLLTNAEIAQAQLPDPTSSPSSTTTLEPSTPTPHHYPLILNSKHWIIE
jgi:hypothetical protein